MPGNAKYAERMGKHLDESIDAACPVSRPGGTTAQIGGNVGGAVGAAIATGSSTRPSDLPLGQYGWLGLGADHFAITKASMMGKPTGDPLARIAYRDVTQLSVTEGKLTLRVDLDVADGKHVAFETKRLGANKPSVEVIELLRARCTAGG